MKHLILPLMASLALLTACNQKSSPEKATPPSEKVNPIVKPNLASPESFRTGLGSVYQGYLNIQTALAEDDFGKAKDAFQSMHGILHMLPEESLEGPAKAYWDSSDAALMQVLHPMAVSKDIREMRTHFMDFTPIMADMVEKFGAPTDGPAYLYHCPMARGKRGADWLQKGTVKMNPYLGKSMPDCGSRIRELNSPQKG